uniref:Uncharacterized protein n=1 Tax=viral metagenome TaxID=1070528 RepID=A0A6M3IE24_9ZZZZ
MEEDIKILIEILNEIEKKPVIKRTNKEHQMLIAFRYNDSVRKYLLSMGEFK